MALFDTSQFTRRLAALRGAISEALPRAAGKAGMALIHDANSEPPTTPIDSGRLRESGSVIVGHEVQTTQGAAGTNNGTPCTDPQPAPEPNRAVAFIGFNTPYAAKVHNVPMNFEDPDAGNHYLTLKMKRRRRNYVEIATAALRKEIGV